MVLAERLLCSVSVDKRVLKVVMFAWSMNFLLSQPTALC